MQACTRTGELISAPRGEELDNRTQKSVLSCPTLCRVWRRGTDRFQGIAQRRDTSKRHHVNRRALLVSSKLLSTIFLTHYNHAAGRFS